MDDRTAARETLARVRELVGRTARAGVRHLGPAAVREIEALERDARAHGLVHLERELAALATEARRYLDRSPRFRPGAFADRLVRLRRRVLDADRALAGPPGPRDGEWLGVARRRYEPVPGRVTVEAVSASGFVTDAGFVGLTVHLVEPSTGRELQASIVRPTAGFGEDPRRLWYQPVSQVTLLSVAELAHGAWTLDDVRCSADGRLSLHAGLVALPAAPSPSRALAAYRVPGLREAAARLPTDGDEDGVRVCVDGLAPGTCAVDDTRGTATVVFTDARGATARLVLSLAPRHDVLLDNLARLRQRPAGALFGRLTAGPGGLRFDPATAWFDAPLRVQHARVGAVQQVHLTLEPLLGAVDRGAGVLPPEVPLPPDAAQVVVSRTWELVTELLAGGTGRPEAVEADLAEVARDAAPLGMVGLAGALAELGGALGSGADPTEPALSLASRARRLERGLALARLQEAVGGPSPPPSPTAPRRGADRGVWPLGVLAVPGRPGLRRVVVLGLDLADGSPLAVRDEWSDVGGGRVASRLFQGPLDPEAALGRVWVFTDHPLVRTRDGRELHPAFHTAPRLGQAVDPARLPRLDAPGTAACRVAVEAARGPDGWVLTGAEGPLDAEWPEALELLLDRAGAGPSEVVVAPWAGVHHVLTWERWHPAVSVGPRWAWSAVVARAAGGPLAALVADVAADRLPAGPDAPLTDDERRAVAGAVAQARQRALAGDELPAARAVLAWGAALGRRPPAAVLGVPDRVDRAVVRPLARWLADADADAEEALWWLLATGERARWFDPDA